METLQSDDPVAVALTAAVQAGDLPALRALLAAHPGLARATITNPRGRTRTPLHLVADWPGYFPEGPAIVRLLVDAGADPDVPMTGHEFAETPLHWAASSDDVEVAAALVDAGADIEAPGASIGGGPPLWNAVGYGCWHVARLLVARGARVDALWVAAALGLQDRVADLVAADPPPGPDELDAAFWQACHGGQRRTAAWLLNRGADIDAVPGYSDHSPLDIAGSIDTRRDTLVAWLGERGATSARAPAGA